MNDFVYIFYISEPEINSTIFDLGNNYDRINESIIDKFTLYSERFDVEEKSISNNVFRFLLDVGFVDDCDHYLTDEGKVYFELSFIFNDCNSASDIIKQKLLLNPIVNLIGQVFYGRGKIGIEQLRILLNYHKISDREIEGKEVTSLLTLLNRYQILTYDKKNRVFYLKHPINPETPIKQYFVNPTTPFSNIYNVRKVIRACTGDVFWIDKHFRKEALEIIFDGLPNENVTSITIISGLENVTASAKSDYESLQRELKERSVVLSWRIIKDTSFKWHDRWIVSNNLCYNIPPVLSIIRGQRADIIKTDIQLDITPFLNISFELNLSV